MVVSNKIEEAKNCFNTINQSGKNDFQHFSYFETKDIYPVVRRVCKQFNLKTKFVWDYENCVIKLVITDNDDNSSEEYYLPVTVPNDTKAGNYMQSIGSIQTYAMRYLYIQAFEITIPDTIDSVDQQSRKNSKNDDVNEWSIPDDVDEIPRSVFQTIRKDFGKRVPFKKETILNKLKSMRNSKKIDNSTYIRCQKIVKES